MSGDPRFMSEAELRADNQRLREKIHAIHQEADKRIAPLQARCDEFDNWRRQGRDHFAALTTAVCPIRGVEMTWWGMTSEDNRRAVIMLLAECERLRALLDPANDTAVRLVDTSARQHGSVRLRDRPDTDEESFTTCACGAVLPSLAAHSIHRAAAVLAALRDATKETT